MTSGTATDTPAPSPGVLTGEAMKAPTLQAIPIADVIESPRNARRHYDSVKLDELAASLRRDGQLTPCLVRWSDALGGYELAAGHRRRRAAEIAGLATLLCLVREMSEEEFLRTLIRENQEREDLHPLDEALGFQQLLDLPGYDVAAVAAALGKSASYVYGRLHLAHLTPAAQEQFLAGKFPVSHALLIARATPEQQEAALKVVADWDGRPRPYDRFRLDLERSFHADLKGVPWKLDDATLLPAAGACLSCPKRSGTLPDLFHDIQGANTCTNVSCHRAKRQAHIARAITEAESGGAPLVQITGRYSERLPAPGKPVPPKWWKEARKKDAGAVRAIDVESGRVLFVTLSLPKDLEKARKRERERANRGGPANRGDEKREKEIAERESAFRRDAAVEILSNTMMIGKLNAAAVLWEVALASLGVTNALDLEGGADLEGAASLLGWPAPPAKAWDQKARAAWVATLHLDRPDPRVIIALVLATDLEVQHWQVRGKTIPDAPALAWAAALVGYDLAEARRNWDATHQAKPDSAVPPKAKARRKKTAA